MAEDEQRKSSPVELLGLVWSEGEKVAPSEVTRHSDLRCCLSRIRK